MTESMHSTSPEQQHLTHRRQLAGQMMMIRLNGTALDADSAQFLRENRIRAVCLFRQNMVDAAQLRQFTADLRAVMGSDALIALDQEGGAVVRATWLPAPPAAMALGAADDAHLAREVGGAVARGIKSLGFNWNFAPVLDLNSNLDNPVIAERAFGADPVRASALALAWMEGSLAEGVACCVKHAPGHGDTHVDSHRALPTVDKSLDALAAMEFSPFRQAAARAPAMMTAHIVYPALDPALPATLSRRILTDLIRRDWRFEGVIITDSMDMAAITSRFGVGNAAVLALQAGADMVMALGSRTAQQDTLDAVAAAILDNALSGRALRRRIARLDGLANAYPCGGDAYLTEAADQALMREAWRRGLSAYRNPQAPPPGSRVRLVVRADAASDGVSEAGPSAQQLHTWLSTLYDVSCTTFSEPDAFDWDSLPQDGRVVILASAKRTRYDPSVRRSWRPDLHLALWSPFQALDIDAPAIMSYGFAPAALDAVAAWLQGQLQALGVNPCIGPTTISQ
jgi:beta-N-acetylhexosaminidase